MSKLNLAQASKIAEAALERAGELNLKPLCIAVLDAGGHLITLKRQDGASNMRPQIAIGKASGALGLGVSSRIIADMAAERPTFVSSIASLAPDGLVPAAGGVLAYEDGELVGSVGVTGDTSDNDEACALAGLIAAGLSNEK